MSLVKKQLHVLFISTDREIFREGSEAHLRMLDYASIMDELRIIVYTKKSSGFVATQIGKNAWAYPTNSISRWFYVFDAIRLAENLFTPQFGIRSDFIEEDGKDVVNLVSAQDPFECGLAGYRISKKLHIPLQLQIHTDFLNKNFTVGSKLNFLRVKIAKFLLVRHAKIRVVSERIKSSIFKNIWFPKSDIADISVLPVFVDRERFRNSMETNFLSEKYPNHTLLVLVVSRLEKEKNVELALKILSETTRRSQESFIGLVIVGDGSEKKALKKMAEKLHIADRVFFEGAVADVGPYYKAADVLLVTSKYEGYGRMIAEATAAGCFVITPDVGAARELVTQSSGVVCNDDDEECLLRNILFLCSTSYTRDQFKSVARISSSRAVFESKSEYLEKYRELLLSAANNEDYFLDK